MHLTLLERLFITFLGGLDALGGAALGGAAGGFQSSPVAALYSALRASNVATFLYQQIEDDNAMMVLKH